MKNIKISTVLFVLFIFFVSCTKNKDENTTNQNKENLHYTCSMDPQIKEDKPGKCPICHMTLTPIKKEETAVNEIKLSEQQIHLGNITTQTLEATQRSLEATYTGVLAIDQTKIKTISARASGRIEKLYFKTTGDYVKKNDPVYVLYSEDIAVAKQDYYAAFKQLSMPGDFGKNAQNLLVSAKQKLLFFGLSNSQIVNLKTTAEISPYTTFYSSVNGYITEIATTEGSYIMEGNGIVKVTDLSSLWLETQINVNYSSNINVGQKATVSFIDFPNLTINSKISFVNPEINEDSRLLLIRLEIPNPNLALKPGMQAVTKLISTNIKGLFIPSDAVIRDEKASYIWIEKSPGIYENLMIEIGMETNGLIEIKSKIDASKKIVITGAYAINSEYIFRKGIDPMKGMKM